MCGDLEIEITKMWAMKTKIVPVLIGALGVFKKNSEKELGKILGHINFTKLRRIALLG